MILQKPEIFMIYLVPGTSLDNIHQILNGAYPLDDSMFLDFLIKKLDEVGNDNGSEKTSGEGHIHS